MFNGKIHYKWWFSILMIDYQRVFILRQGYLMKPKGAAGIFICSRILLWHLPPQQNKWLSFSRAASVPCLLCWSSDAFSGRQNATLAAGSIGPSCSASSTGNSPPAWCVTLETISLKVHWYQVDPCGSMCYGRSPYLVPSSNQTWRAGKWTIYRWFSYSNLHS